MGAITGTKTVLTEFGGQYKVLHLTATLAATSDTITLTAATHGISVITGIVGQNIRTGMGANFATLHVAYSGLVITVTSLNAAGAAATTFGNIELTLIGY
jgi:hypothetical protein